MRCKPDQLCRIIRCSQKENKDRFVTTVRLDPIVSALDGEPNWFIKSQTPLRTLSGDLTTEGFIADSCLRPIDDPESGGVEQTTFQKPVPQRKTFATRIEREIEESGRAV